MAGAMLDEAWMRESRPPQSRRPIMCVPGCQEALQAALSRRGFFKGAAAAGFAAAAIVPAEAQKQEEGRAPAAGAKAPEGQSYFKGVVDLTHTMSPEFPTFFGVPGIELQKQYDFKKDGFNLNWWRIIEHAGTHLDAPIHFSEDGATADAIVAGELVVPLAVIDVRKQAEKDADYLMSIEDVLTWEKRFKKLPNSCCVAMLSGWSAACWRRRQVHRQGRGRHLPFPGHCARARRMAVEGAQGAGSGGRYAVARPRPVEGFQDPSHLAAGRALGSGERRQPGKAVAVGGHPGGRPAQGERLHRRSGAADRADLICHVLPESIDARLARKRRRAGICIPDVMSWEDGRPLRSFEPVCPALIVGWMQLDHFPSIGDP